MPKMCDRCDLEVLVKKRIAEEPFELDGQTPAKDAQRWFAVQAGVSVRTLRDWVKEPPLVWDCIQQVDGRKVFLLRVGAPDPNDLVTTR